MDTFLSLYLDNEMPRSVPSQLFLQALGECISYLSADHIEVVNQLRKINQIGTCKAVCHCFLAKTVECWAHSGLFKATDLVESVSNGTSKKIFSIKLAEDLKKVEPSDEMCTAILDLFRDDVVLDVPEVSAVTFYGGVRYSVTTMDMILCRLLANICRKLNGHDFSMPIKADEKTALCDAYAMKLRIRHFPDNVEQPPVEEKTAGRDVKEKLLYRKQLHNFLFQQSYGMKYFNLEMKAVRKILRYTNYSLAERMTVKDDNPCRFMEEHRLSYAIGKFKTYTKNLQGFVARRNKAKHKRRLAISIQKRIENGHPLGLAIVGGTADYVNEWKQKYQLETKQEMTMTKPGLEWDVPLCQCYVEVSDALAFNMILSKMSEEDLEWIANDYVLQDPLQATDAIDLMSQTSLGLIETVYRKAKKGFGEAFHEGDWLAILLELEEFLAPFVKYIDPTSAKGGIQVLENDPFPLQVMMLNCVIELNKIRKGKHNLLSKLLNNVSEQGNPFNDDLFEKIERLTGWFGFELPAGAEFEF